MVKKMGRCRKNRSTGCLMLLFLTSFITLLVGIVWAFNSIEKDVIAMYGEPATSLSWLKRNQLSFQLYFSGANLFQDTNQQSEDYFFEILPGEAVGQIAYRMKMNQLIEDSELFKTYLIYKGYDRLVQSGLFKIKPEMNSVEIAEKIINPIPDKVRVIILPGWRAEEIAQNLDGFGMMINSDEFLSIINNPDLIQRPEQLSHLRSLEGYLAPGEYLVDREMTTKDFISLLLTKFTENIDPGLLTSLSEINLTIDQAVIIASMVEKEAVHVDEMPAIASVYLNRWHAGMKFDSDPTVQYAIGFNQDQSTWWTNPLSTNDLTIDSPFNTYIYIGLMPHPICNPGLNAIRAVATAPQTSFFYFRAKCDGGGYHNFSETYEQHLSFGCQ